MKSKNTALEKQYKETELGPLPRDWEFVRLGNHCNVYSGYAFKSNNFVNEGILIIKIRNLQDGTIKIDKKSSYYPVDKLDEKLEKFILKSGDILIALTGATTGKIAVVPIKFKNSLLNQRVGKFQIFSTKLYSNFFRFFSLSKQFQQSIQDNILKSAQGNISPKQIENFKIPR